MKTIPLVDSDKVARVDDDIFNDFGHLKFWLLKGENGSQRVIHYVGARYRQLAVWICEPPKGFSVIYRDRDGLNLQRSNLFVASKAEAAAFWSRSCGGASGLRGIRLTRVSKLTGQQTYQVICGSLGAGARYVGSVRSLEEASQIREREAALRWGSLAGLM